MKVDGHMIPVLLLVNIYVHANTRALFFSDPRPRFFNDTRMCFLYYYLGRRRWGRYFSRGGSYRRRRLLTSGDPERDTGENEPRKECSGVLFHVVGFLCLKR